jgi:hypothetical protein
MAETSAADSKPGGVDKELVERLGAELDRLANAQFETPEFELFLTVPLTMERARFFALQHVLYNLNRRDCWGYVQARAPWDVKRIIWKHEEDELIHDPRGGADHYELMAKQAYVLGATKEDVANITPTPLLEAVFFGFIYLASTLPWLGALTASHFLERRNNADIVKGGGASARWRDRMVNELSIDAESLISSNVHVEADVDHSDDIWAAIAAYIKDEKSYGEALDGAIACCAMDRAYRGAAAHGMAAV